MSTTRFTNPGPILARRLEAGTLAARMALGSDAERLAATQGFVLTCDQARRCGVDRAGQRRLVRRAAWTAVRFGVLSVLPPTGPGLSGTAPAVVASAAVLVHAGHVISVDSAAAVHGLPLLGDVVRPALTATWAQAAGNWPDIVVRVAGLAEVDVTRWCGTPVTTIARTVCDLGRLSLRAGFVAAEAALHEGALAYVELEDALNRQRGWPGVRTARLVAGLADALSESPLESLVRLFLHESQLPLPAQQRWVVTDEGVYRVDGLWEDRAVVLEVDGMLKYRTPVEPGDEDPLGAEKRRQEALERAGYRVVRVTWSDLHRHPERTLARIRAALALGGDRIRSRHSRLQGQLPTFNR